MGADPFNLVGTAIRDQYRVDELVGEGGFGLVYRGFHLSFEQPIAIKCLKVPAHFTRVARALFLDKFRDEGKHLAKLHHDAIVRVFDFGVEADSQIPYLVLEWLTGEDLEHHLAARRVVGPGEVSKHSSRYSEQEAMRLLWPAMDAIALAHREGIAHRDIKPANIFLTDAQDGNGLRVLDFGIAKAMQEGETATQLATKTSSGFSAFSPQYGAPEQFQSKKFGPTGPWTDVHALGLILVEMVVGRAPFQGEEMADFLLAAINDKRPTPRNLGAQVSDSFEAFCARALARTPKNRFQNAGELLSAIGGPVARPAQPTIGPTVQAAPADVVEDTAAGAATADFLAARGLQLEGKDTPAATKSTANGTLANAHTIPAVTDRQTPAPKRTDLGPVAAPTIPGEPAPVHVALPNATGVAPPRETVATGASTVHAVAPADFSVAGKLVAVNTRHGALPARCVVCGSDQGVEYARETLRWGAPSFWWIVVPAITASAIVAIVVSPDLAVLPIVLSLMVFIPMKLFVGGKATLRIPYCRRDLTVSRTAILVRQRGIITASGLGLGGGLLGAIIDDATGGAPLLYWASVIVVPMAILAITQRWRSPGPRAVRFDKPLVYLEGVHASIRREAISGGD